MNHSRAYVIAEAGVNHNGSLETAKRLIAAAAAGGCDAVKFQTFKAKGLVSARAPKCAYQAATTGREETQLEMILRLELDEAAHRQLVRTAADEGIDFISTPFDEESAILLVELGVKRIKLSSGEIANLPFLGRVASLGKPILLSTGMAYLAEVDEAVRVIEEKAPPYPPNHPPPLTLLHCVSEYPAPLEEVNLRCLATLREAFQLPVGYSDHTLGIEIPLAAAALGAAVIEKHFTFDRTLPGPDHRASLEVPELEAMVRGIRKIEAAIGDGRKIPAPSEMKNRELARRSLVAARDLRAGEVLAEEDLAAKRPGSGLPPHYKKILAGARLQKDVARDVPIAWDDLLARPRAHGSGGLNGEADDCRH